MEMKDVYENVKERLRNYTRSAHNDSNAFYKLLFVTFNIQ